MEEFTGPEGAAHRAFLNPGGATSYFLKSDAFDVVTDSSVIDKTPFFSDTPRGRCKILLRPSENAVPNIREGIAFAIHTLREGIKSGKNDVGNIRANTEGLGPLLLVADSWPEMARGINQLVGRKHAILEDVISTLDRPFP
jgi:hypothetical protein